MTKYIFSFHQLCKMHLCTWAQPQTAASMKPSIFVFINQKTNILKTNLDTHHLKLHPGTYSGRYLKALSELTLSSVVTET